MQSNNGANDNLIERKKSESVSSRFFDMAIDLIMGLPERSREIIKKRFGLGKEKNMTLEAIGAEYGITRERVRQIITDAVKNVIKDETKFKGAEDAVVFTIEKNNGIIREKNVSEKMGVSGWREINAVKFIAFCSKKIHVIEEKGKISPSWTLSKKILEDIKKLEKVTLEVLEKEKKLLEDEEISENLMMELSGLEKKQILAYLDVLLLVQKNKFGRWGRSSWTEVNPKGTREKVYLVLKEEKRPLHFTEIAKLIDKHNLSKGKVHPQTVHNELIKDDRFVLIGRGIYAMREWGYNEGTIKDVITEILKKAGRPMKKEDILKKVFSEREVKRTTVMINLNNSKLFERKKEYYALKK